MVLEKTPEDNVDGQENQQMDHQANQPEFLLKAQMSRLKLSSFEYIPWRPSSLLLEEKKKRTTSEQGGWTEFQWW